MYISVSIVIMKRECIYASSHSLLNLVREVATMKRFRPSIACSMSEKLSKICLSRSESRLLQGLEFETESTVTHRMLTSS